MRTTHDERMAEAAAKLPGLRLPKWARDYVAQLERDLERTRAMLEEAKQGPPDSNVFRVWGFRSDDQAIGHNAHLRFRLGGDWDCVYVRLDYRGGGKPTLYVAGDRSITIEPAAGNAIHIRLTER